MFSWVVGLIDRLFAVAGALIFSQIPQFIGQYQQHLSGHVSELDWQIGLMTQAAQNSGKTLDQYIHKFLSSIDIDFARQGELMQGMLNRFTDLSSAFTAINEANVYARPLVFIQHFNLDIAKRTYENFEFGLLFTLEGLVYAMVGLVAGYIFFLVLKKIVLGFIPNRKPKVGIRNEG